jgi:two-component system, NarL family, sensor kinase
LQPTALIQEALNNVVRHAEANTCTVTLAINEGSALIVEVSDDGRGIPNPQENSSVRTGVGLTSMRERASELGGSLIVEPLPEGGTLVRAGLPLPKED